ncbi:MAG TPA: DUF2085 domain-containing protein [Roseiflexaceae bacterium]|jgi:uncharacterized membrane protein|nr:DUF2085 domain-containing protein [Roseiflexaceae bacterium]
MSQPSSDDIIKLAQQRIATREERVDQERAVRDLPWRYAFWGLLGVLLAGLLFWPSLPLQWKLYAAVHGVCAQIHNVNIGGLQLPICARNTGIYSSFLLSSVVLLAFGRKRAARLPPWPITAVLVVFVIILGLDGFNSMALDAGMPTLYQPHNEIRTITGVGLGISIAVMITLILNMSLRRDADHELPVIKNWLELGGLVLLNLLVVAAMYGNLTFMYWPIAIIAWLGITGTLYCVNILVSALLMGYENRVVRLGQLVKPATIAIVLTGIELGLLATARFYLEGQGMLG